MTDLHPALPAAVQPERSGELHPGALVAAVDRAATENDAIRLLTQRFPEWSISKARKLAREIRTDQEIARERAVLPPVAGDRLGRAAGERQMKASRRLVHDLPDRTGDRATFNLDELAAMPQLPKKKAPGSDGSRSEGRCSTNPEEGRTMTIISDVTHTGESDTTTVRDIPTLPEHPSWCDGADEWEPANVPGDTDDRFHHFRTEWFQAVRVDFRDPTTGQINPGPNEIECTLGSLAVEDVESAIAQLTEIKRRLDQDRA